jgi:hypothetical protein
MTNEYRILCYHKDSENMIINISRGDWVKNPEDAKIDWHQAPDGCTCTSVTTHRRAIETVTLSDLMAAHVTS